MPGIHLAILLALVTNGAQAFGVSKRIFPQRRAVPRVEHIPLYPSSKISSIPSHQACESDIGNSKRRGLRNRFRSLRDRVRGLKKTSNLKSGRHYAVIGVVASALLSLVIKPTKALAMGAMGGPKGPVAPMQRYVEDT